MGAGGSSTSASVLAEAEELLTCSVLLGRAMAALTFPDIHRIQDFHSKCAPELASQKLSNRTEREIFAAMFDDVLYNSDGEDGGNGRPQGLTENAGRALQEEEGGKQPSENFDYHAHFTVLVGSDKIVIDDVSFQNEDGWTPLHSCCHSHTAISAGLAIVEQMVRKDGCNFEQRTLRGPGTHNAGWTALHMAAAYGVEPLVFQLLHVGASPNARNSLDWAPLNEAAHRGFTAIVKVSG